MQVDRREESKDIELHQGKVLITRITKRWSPEEISKQNEIEKRMLFADFNSFDEVRGRTLVFVAESESEAVLVMNEHNDNVNSK